MKFSKKKKEVAISTRFGGTKILAYVSHNGVWAIHRPLYRNDGFFVTHLPSGNNINASGTFKNITDAKKAIRLLNPITDWKNLKVTTKIVCGEEVKSVSREILRKTKPILTKFFSVAKRRRK